MDRGEVAEALAKPISQELLGSSIPARLAYVRGAARGTRALYDQMVLITVEPDWAKLLDFDTTLPEVVEDLVRAQQDAQ